MINYDGICRPPSTDELAVILSRAYGSAPDQCPEVDVVVLGSGLGLAGMPYLLEQGQRVLGAPLRIAVVDRGTLGLLTHMGNTPSDRGPFLQAGVPFIGGRTSLWGVSTPRPPDTELHCWPYPYADLIQRFTQVEREMGILDTIPASGGALECHLLDRLQTTFPWSSVRTAPLAIDRYGHRWSSLDRLPDLAARGVHIIPRFQCVRLVTEGNSQLKGVQGIWQDGRLWEIRARVVVLSIDVEDTLALLSPVCPAPIMVEACDHIRIDLHGSLPAQHFGDWSVDQCGVAVLLMSCRSQVEQVPYHVEIKVAPRPLWRFMPSGDNLQGDADDPSIWVQIQTISAMHDRFPAFDLLNVSSTISPVWSPRDALFHNELVRVMLEIASAIGLSQPVINFRELGQNHHTYGALRVGKAVTPEFRVSGMDNLYVLPPTAYVDTDDDANPVLKSRVLAQYAMDAIVQSLSL